MLERIWKRLFAEENTVEEKDFKSSACLSERTLNGNSITGWKPDISDILI